MAIAPDPTRPGSRIALSALLLASVVGACQQGGAESAPGLEGERSPDPRARPLAVLGDSDSAGYQDRVGLTDPAARGGAHRALTLQWTEVLDRLRGDWLDLGPRVEVGEESALGAALSGLVGRAPRAHKHDNLYNFAQSGWGCASLLDGHRAQVPALLEQIAQAPSRWARGAVVIRIGVNDFGQRDSLQALALDPHQEALIARIDACVDAIRRSRATLHAAQPELLVVLVGVFDNTHWVPLQEQFGSREQLDNISLALDRFDAGLRRLADEHSRTVFFDDRAWFARHFGSRDAHGRPAYRDLRFGSAVVRNAQGDAPSHAVVADGHAGTGWNALWASALIELLAEALPEPALRPLGEDEIERLLVE
jgi:hypothetical protein